MHDAHSPFSADEPPDQGAHVDARVKTLIAMGAIAAVVASTHIALPVACFITCMLIAVTYSIRLRMRRLLLLVGFALTICVLQLILSGQSDTARDVLLASRVLGAASVLLLLDAGLPAQSIFAVLRWMRLPRSMVSIAMLMHRHVHTLFDQTLSALAAQKMRLGYAGWRRSLASMGNLAGIVALRSLDQAERTHQAMVARGYRGWLPVAPLPAMRPRDLVLLLVALSMITVGYIAAERFSL